MSKAYSSTEIEFLMGSLSLKAIKFQKDIDSITKAIEVDDETFSNREKNTDDPIDSDEEQTTNYGKDLMKQRQKLIIDEQFSKEKLQATLYKTQQDKIAIMNSFDLKIKGIHDSIAVVSHSFFSKINYCESQIDFHQNKFKSEKSKGDKKSSKRTPLYHKNCSKLKLANRDLKNVKDAISEILEREVPLMLVINQKRSEEQRLLLLQEQELENEKMRAVQKVEADAILYRKELRWAAQKAVANSQHIEQTQQNTIKNSSHLQNITVIKTLCELLAYDDKYMVDRNDYLTEDERVIFKQLEISLENSELPPVEIALEQIVIPVVIPTEQIALEQIVIPLEKLVSLEDLYKILDTTFSTITAQEERDLLKQIQKAEDDPSNSLARAKRIIALEERRLANKGFIEKVDKIVEMASKERESIRKKFADVPV